MQAPPPVALGEKGKKSPTLGQRIRNHFGTYWPEYVTGAGLATLYGVNVLERSREAVAARNRGNPVGTVIGVPAPRNPPRIRVHRVRVDNPEARMQPAPA